MDSSKYCSDRLLGTFFCHQFRYDVFRARGSLQVLCDTCSVCGAGEGGLTQSRDTKQGALTLYYLLEHGYIQRLGQLYQFLQFYRCLNTEEGRPIGSDARPALSHNLHGRHLLTTPTTPISPTPLRACVVNRRACVRIKLFLCGWLSDGVEICSPLVVLRSADKPRHSTAAV